MNPYQRERIAYAPQLAVIYVLRAAVDATCDAIATAHPFANFDPPSSEDRLANQLYQRLVRLDRAARAYCEYIGDLPQLGLFPPTDSSF
jgi:hypothetical protein